MRRRPLHAEPAQLDRLFFALADATRRGMLEQLSRGPASVSALADGHDMALPSIVKHLGVLEQGGFVSSSKVGRVRTYNITPAAFSRMEAWVTAHKARLHARFDNPEAYLAKPTARRKP